MIRAKVFALASVAFLGAGIVLEAQERGQELKGTVQIKVGSHRVKLEAGKVYEVVLDAPKDHMLNVTIPFGGGASFVRDKNNRVEKTYFMSSRNEDYDFVVYPNSSLTNATVDYALKIKAFSLAEKPLLEENGRWTADDPTYKPARDSYFKDYKLRLKAGELCVIDLVKGGPGIDPYLYLEGPDGKVAAQDDDSGGDLNARIIFAAPRDGEYRIIATTLVKTTGNFTLKARRAE